MMRLDPTTLVCMSLLAGLLTEGCSLDEALLDAIRDWRRFARHFAGAVCLLIGLAAA